MASWMTTTGNNIPEGAIRAVYEKDGKPMFIARSSMEGVLTPGKCGYHLEGAYIPHDCKEQVVNNYEVLVLPNSTPGFYDWIKFMRQTAKFQNMPTRHTKICT